MNNFFDYYWCTWRNEQVRQQICKYSSNRLVWKMRISFEDWRDFSGCHPSYFLLVFQSILSELLLYFDQSTTSDSNYALTLCNILQKLTTISDRPVLDQILNNESVRQQSHALLYRCLSTNRKEISLVIDLWNIYGRII